MPKVFDMSTGAVLARLDMTKEGKDLVALARNFPARAKRQIEAARKEAGTHVATAKALGMSRDTLYSLMRTVGL